MNKNNKADQVLLMAFVLFLGALLLKQIYHDSFFAKAFFVAMEAALVGGIADWFAVTALFTKPLGFPWHTALIPNNRKKLIEATAQMVQHEFLSKEKIKEQISGASLVVIIIDWVEKQNGKQVLSSSIAWLIGKILKELDPNSVATDIEMLLKKYLNQLSLAPAVQWVAKWVLDKHKEEQFLDYILTQLRDRAQGASTKQIIYEYLQQYKAEQASGLVKSFFCWIGEKTNAINLDDAADSFQCQLVYLLNDLLDRPEHPLRDLFRQMIDNVAQVSSHPEWCITIETWKQAALARANFQEPLLKIVKLLLEEAQHFSDGQENPPNLSPQMSLLRIWTLATLDQYWEVFRQDQLQQERVEKYLQLAVCHIIDNGHDIIGDIVRKAMQVLSADDLNNLIASRMAEDLQYIRINGSIVGGIAGIVIFLIIEVVHSSAVAQFLQ